MVLGTPIQVFVKAGQALYQLRPVPSLSRDIWMTQVRLGVEGDSDFQRLEILPRGYSMNGSSPNQELREQLPDKEGLRSSLVSVLILK